MQPSDVHLTVGLIFTVKVSAQNTKQGLNQNLKTTFWHLNIFSCLFLELATAGILIGQENVMTDCQITWEKRPSKLKLKTRLIGIF